MMDINMSRIIMLPNSVPDMPLRWRAHLTKLSQIKGAGVRLLHHKALKVLRCRMVTNFEVFYGLYNSYGNEYNIRYHFLFTPEEKITPLDTGLLDSHSKTLSMKARCDTTSVIYRQLKMTLSDTPHFPVRIPIQPVKSVFLVL